MRTNSVIAAFTVTFILSLAGRTDAFTAKPSFLSLKEKEQTPVFLHPSQAADLEACAYDLMKEALEQKAKLAALANKSKYEEEEETDLLDYEGPVSWCRRHLWPFQSNGETETDTALSLKP
jgi:hypothetical protein